MRIRSVHGLRSATSVSKHTPSETRGTPATSTADWARIWERAVPAELYPLMSPQERAEFESLPNSVTVYRGFNLPEGWRGFSWTLDQDRAAWFAARFAVLDGPPILATMTVTKADVLMYVNTRGEREVVLLPPEEPPALRSL